MIGSVWGRRLSRVHMQGQGINASVAPNPPWIQGISKVGTPNFCEIRCWDDDLDHVRWISMSCEMKTSFTVQWGHWGRSGTNVAVGDLGVRGVQSK